MATSCVKLWMTSRKIGLRPDLLRNAINCSWMLGNDSWIVLLKIFGEFHPTRANRHSHFQRFLLKYVTLLLLVSLFVHELSFYEESLTMTTRTSARSPRT